MSSAPAPVVAMAYQILWMLEGAENVAEADWLAAGTDDESADTLRIVTKGGFAFTVTVQPLNAAAAEKNGSMTL